MGCSISSPTSQPLRRVARTRPAFFRVPNSLRYQDPTTDDAFSASQAECRGFDPHRPLQVERMRRESGAERVAEVVKAKSPRNPASFFAGSTFWPRVPGERGPADSARKTSSPTTGRPRGSRRASWRAGEMGICASLSSSSSPRESGRSRRPRPATVGPEGHFSGDHSHGRRESPA